MYLFLISSYFRDFFIINDSVLKQKSSNIDIHSKIKSMTNVTMTNVTMTNIL